MANVYWRERARADFEALPPRVQQAVEEHLDHVRRFPEMYRRVEWGRYHGHRRFLVLGRYHVYYRLFGDPQQCFVTAIRPARARPE